MTANRGRPDREEPVPGRLVIDLRTDTGSLTRDDIRRLAQELENQVAAASGEHEPAPGPWNHPGQPGPQGYADQSGQWDRPSPTANGGQWDQGGYGDPRGPWHHGSSEPQPQRDPRGQWDQADPRGQWDQADPRGQWDQADPRGQWDQADRGPAPTQLIGRNDQSWQDSAPARRDRPSDRMESRSDSRSASRSGGRPEGRSASRSRSRSGGRSTGRARSARSGKTQSRSPLLVRTTIVVGLIAALAASISRVDQDTGTAVPVARGATTGNVQVTTSAVAGGTMMRNGAQSSALRTAAPVVPAPTAVGMNAGTNTGTRVGAGTAARGAGTGVGRGAAANTGTGAGTGATGANTGRGTRAGANSICNINYSVTLQTPTQFNVVIVLTNTGKKKINGWTLHWEFPAKQKIIYGWNAMVTNGPGGAEATGIGVDQRIASGAAVTIGFAGVRGGWIPTPTDFALNGQPCSWHPTA